MAISATCTKCLQVLKVAEKFAGRKALCPLCENAVAIPKEGEKAAAVAAVNFMIVLDRFAISDWDKTYCKLVVTQKLASNKAIRSAVIDVRKRMRAGHGALPVGEVLVTDGALTAAQHRQISVTVSKKPEAPGELEAEEDHKPCPNCFETIPASSKKCPFCAESLADLTVMDMCPNCKHQQLPEGRFCQECGADMETGLVGGATKRKCPRCGMMSTGMEKVCPICATSFDKPTAMVTAEKTAKKIITRVRNNFGYMVLIALIAAGFWVYKNRSDLWTRFRSGVHGETETQLENALDEWISALKYKDFDVLNGMITEGKVEKADIAAILGHKGAEIKEVMEINKTSVKKDGNRATVYIDSKIRIPAKDESSGTANLEAIGKIMRGDESGKTVLTAKTVWKWALKDGRWLYVHK